MTGLAGLQKKLEVLTFMSTAIKNLLLYPATSNMIASTVNRLYETLQPILSEEKSLVFSEAERILLVQGEPLPKKEMDRPQVVAFLQIFLNFGIKSLSFENGLQIPELIDFMGCVAKKPEEVQQAGGLNQLMKQKGVTHILLDQKVYIARDKDQQILNGVEISDEQLVQIIQSAHPGTDLDMDMIKSMARDAEWVHGIFQAGMNQILQNKGTMSNVQLGAKMMRMIGVLDKAIEKEDHEKMARTTAQAASKLDPECIELILMQKIDNLFSGHLMPYFVDTLSEETFQKVTERMNPFDPENIRKAESDPEGDATRTSIYQSIMNSGRGQRYKQDVAEKDKLEREEEDRLILQAKEDAQSILIKGDETMIRDPQTELVADVVKKLSTHKEQETAQALINRLCDAIRSRNPDLRSQTSVTLAEVLDRLSSGDRIETLGRISPKMVDWLQNEYQAIPAYKRICGHVRDYAQYLLQQGQIAQAVPILGVFHAISTGMLDKNDTIHAVATEVIKALAKKENMDILFDEFRTNKNKKQTEAGQALTKLDEWPLPRLLELLRDEAKSDERIRIMNIIIKTGQVSVPVLQDKVEPADPWYFVRNIAYMLGRISSPASMGALRGLLDHEHAKVRDEVLSSIYRIGGTERGEILLSALPTAEEKTKSGIVEMLGKLRIEAAVPVLIDLLKSRPLISSATRVDLEEKICVALGNTGSPDAIPILTEVSSRSFFNLKKSYPEKVQLAASKALTSLKTKKG